MSSPKYHVAIVGAGLGGLAAAIAIARAGHKVTILEQATALGEVSVYSGRDLNCWRSADYLHLSRLAQGSRFHQILPVSLNDGIS